MRFSTNALLRLLPFLIFLLLMASCGDDAESSMRGDDDSNAPPSLEIRLMDAPGDYDKVIIDIVDVRVKFAGEDFRDFDEDFAGRYDLLELTDGIDTVIATSVVPTGRLSEIRLILGDDNTIHIDDQVIPLRTPSAQQSGLKIKFDNDAELLPGRAYVVILDFDAGRSIVRAGNSGNYNLKPVIRATLREVDLDNTLGAIQAFVTPADRQYVTAINPGVDTLGTYVSPTGRFTFLNVPPATYTLTVRTPNASIYPDFIRENIIVTTGELTDLGLLDLN